jgi:hypothetical protein
VIQPTRGGGRESALTLTESKSELEGQAELYELIRSCCSLTGATSAGPLHDFEHKVSVSDHAGAGGGMMTSTGVKDTGGGGRTTKVGGGVPQRVGGGAALISEIAGTGMEGGGNSQLAVPQVGSRCDIGR